MNKGNGIIGFRKFLVTLIAIACAMTAGYTMEEYALNPVLYAIVGIQGVFLTGNLWSKRLNRVKEDDEFIGED